MTQNNTPEQLQITNDKPVVDLEFLNHIKTLKYLGEKDIPFNVLEKALQELAFLKRKRAEISSAINKRLIQITQQYDESFDEIIKNIDNIELLIKCITSQHEDRFESRKEEGLTLKNKHFEYGDIEIIESKNIKIKLHKPKPKGDSKCQ